MFIPEFQGHKKKEEENLLKLIARCCAKPPLIQSFIESSLETWQETSPLIIYISYSKKAKLRENR